MRPLEENLAKQGPQGKSKTSFPTSKRKSKTPSPKFSNGQMQYWNQIYGIGSQNPKGCDHFLPLPKNPPDSFSKVKPLKYRPSRIDLVKSVTVGPGAGPYCYPILSGKKLIIIPTQTKSKEECWMAITSLSDLVTPLHDGRNPWCKLMFRLNGMMNCFMNRLTKLGKSTKHFFVLLCRLRRMLTLGKYAKVHRIVSSLKLSPPCGSLTLRAKRIDTTQNASLPVTILRMADSSLLEGLNALVACGFSAPKNDCLQTKVFAGVNRLLESAYGRGLTSVSRQPTK